MSDNQDDLPNKTRNRKAIDSGGVAKPGRPRARKEKAPRENSESELGKKMSSDKSGVANEEKAKAKAMRKAGKAVQRTERGKGGSATDNAIAVSVDDDKAKAKAQRKAEKPLQQPEHRKNAVIGDAPAAALSEEDKVKAKAERKAQRVAKRRARKVASGEGGAVAGQSAAEKVSAKVQRKADKAAQKAERRKNTVAVDGPTKALSVEEKAKAKAERNTRKAAKKSAKRDISGEGLAAVPLSEEETVKAKAERKIAKAAMRSAKKGTVSEGGAASALGDAEKAKTKAERKAAKAAMKSARKGTSGDGGAVATLSDEEKAKAKSERKAAKAAVKSAKKDAAGESGAIATLGDEEKAKSKASRKVEKKEKKAARKNGVRAEAGGDAEDERGERQLRIALRGFDAHSADGLRGRLEAALAAAGVAFEWGKEGERCTLIVYAFEFPPARPEEITARIEGIAEDRAKLKVFVGRAGARAPDGSDPFAAENRAIAALAVAFEGAFVDSASLLRRHGVNAGWDSAQMANTGLDVIVAAILGAAACARVSKSAIPHPQRLAPVDLVDARALSAQDILALLNWTGSYPPKLLRTYASKESMEAFLDRKIVLSGDLTLDLNQPIIWPTKLEDRSSQYQVFGLEFLSGPLNYWYSKAGNRSTNQTAEIDAVIKERGATASEILSLAGKIIVDFADKHPLSHSAAWEESAVSRRARVLSLFVLCCMAVAKRKVKFDEGLLLRIFGELLNLIEMLRSGDFYKPGSFDGVQQDSLLVGLALTLRKTPYAELLLTESMERLNALQLSLGLTADGVWRKGPFSDHCTLLAEFNAILSDIGKDNPVLIDPIAAAAKKMMVFAEALLKSDGSPPVFDEGRQKSYLKKLSGTRRALAGAGFGKSVPKKGTVMPRITDTYVFRDAQYFASHSTQKPSPDSSLVILHADAGSIVRNDPGGITLAFAHGGKDLLVCAEPQESTKKRDRAAYFDAALRNGYRISGSGYALDRESKLNFARMVKSWRGEGWAAARSIDETNPAGSVVRTVLHLKAKHALVVVDELAATDGSQTAFEQFWHVAPGLSPADAGEHSLCFSAEAGGTLTITFDANGTATAESEGEGGTGVRRSLQLAKGVVATLFQWNDLPAIASAKIVRANQGDWAVEISGAGFNSRVGLAGDDFQYEPKPLS